MSFRGARKREPGIYNHGCGVWIPDRRFASSGMTACSRFTQLLPTLHSGSLDDFDYIPMAFYLLVTKLTEGRLPETDQRRSMVRPLRAGFVTPLPGGSGAPPAGHYDPAAQDARRTRRKCQSAVCEAVRPELESLSLSNAAVKRREARRSALLAGGPLRKGDRPNRKAATGCGVPHQRLAALHSPHARK